MEKPDRKFSCLADAEKLQHVGDVLLTFGSKTDPVPGRTGGEGFLVEAQRNWTLWFQRTHARWKGFPLTTITVEGWQGWLLGELYGLAGRQPADLLAAVLAGQTKVRELNGHFLFLGWHEVSRTWHLWTDRFGTIHAYYAGEGGRVALGTFSPAVSAFTGSRQLDWTGLTGFFGLGFFPQDRTFFRNVRILRPASCYVFDEQGQLEREVRYWDWWHEPDQRRSYSDTVDAFGHLLEEVITDHTQEGRIALPISGGLDSRTTVAALGAPGHLPPVAQRLWPYSYGYTPDSVETCIAHRVASARGLPLQRFTIQPYLFEHLDYVLSSVEGLQDVTQSRQANISDDLAQHADYVVAAHWGDVWLDDMGLVTEEKQVMTDEQVLAHALMKVKKRGRAWLLENLCRSRVDCDPEAVLHVMMQEEMARVAHLEDPDFCVKALKTDQWSFRWTLASLRMFQPGAFPRLSFYDTRLADFFCTVPSAFLRGRRLQIDYLKRFAPDLARITWQARDADLYHYQHFSTWLLPKRAVKKAWRLLTRKQVIQRNWEVQFLSEQGRQGLEQGLIRPGLHLHEWVAPSAVRALLDAFYEAPGAASGYQVSMLLTFSAWLERYGEA